MSRLRLVAIGALALATALPASVLAAPLDVTGTVTAPDGVPVAGVEIAVLVQDQVFATTTDETGAWALQLDVEPGTILAIDATGVQTRSEPDKAGCVTLTTPTGGVEVTVTEPPMAPIAVPLDGAITGEICSPKDTPAPTPPLTGEKPDTTPPSTDALGARGTGSSGSSLLIVVGLLAIASGGALAATGRRRARPAAARRFQAHRVERDETRRD